MDEQTKRVLRTVAEQHRVPVWVVRLCIWWAVMLTWLRSRPTVEEYIQGVAQDVLAARSGGADPTEHRW